MALGKRALKIGMHIADDVMSGQNIKVAAKRPATDTGKDLMLVILNLCVRLRKRIKRVVATRWVSTAKRRRRRGPTGDVFEDGFRA